jgi:hypothetical protein
MKEENIDCDAFIKKLDEYLDVRIKELHSSCMNSDYLSGGFWMAKDVSMMIRKFLEGNKSE